MKFYKNYISVIILFLLALVIYELTVSNGLYINDTAAVASAMEVGVVNQTYLFQSSPLYVNIGVVLYNLLKLPPEIIFNQISVISMALSVVPFWLILKRFFGRKMADLGTLMYIFLPFIWFNAINAKTYAFSILLSNFFIYFLLFSKKMKINLILLSILFGIISVVHTMNIFLLPLFLVYLNKNRERIIIVLISVLSFIAIRILSDVTLFSQYSYIVANAEIKTIIFALGMNIWALFNSFSIFTFALMIFGVYSFIRYNKEKKLLLWALPAVSMLIYGKESISGMTPVIPFLLFCAVYALTRIKIEWKVLLIIFVCIVFQLVKFVPFAVLMHQYTSPHQLYAEAILNMTTKNDIILGGHEGAWLFGKRTFYTETDNFAIDRNNTYFITMHYVTTENRLELQKLYEEIGKIGLNISSLTNLEIQNNSPLIEKRCNCQYIPRGHNFEDPYLYFTAVSPSIIDRLIFMGNPSYNIEYWVCKVCF